MIDLTNEEEITKKAYDTSAQIWSLQHARRDYWAKEMQKFHQLLPKGRLLEVGAGGGRDAKELIKYGYDYLGTDVSAGLLKVARVENPGLQFEHASVYGLDYQKSFDGFWCAAVLLHIPRKRIQEALSAIHRSIKKGGIGFISIKQGNGESMERDTAALGGGERFFIYWGNEGFKKELETAGFLVLDENLRPVSNRTTWLTYFVKTN